jgi:hypothetical protein
MQGLVEFVWDQKNILKLDLLIEWKRSQMKGFEEKKADSKRKRRF